MPAVSQSSAPSPPIDCAVSGMGVSAQDTAAAATLRRTVERGPLYAVSAARIGVKACRMTQESGAITLEYTFRDGGSLRVTHQPRIEYTDQDVRFATPLADDPVNVLALVERAAFGEQGCGMNWREPRTQPAEDEPRARETIYRGDVCNCQARVRTNAAGRVTGLLFRSAC